MKPFVDIAKTRELARLEQEGKIFKSMYASVMIGDTIYFVYWLVLPSDSKTSVTGIAKSAGEAVDELYSACQSFGLL